MPFFVLLVVDAATVLFAGDAVGIDSARLNAAGLNVSIVVDMVAAPPGRTAWEGGASSYSCFFTLEAWGG